MIEHFGSAFGGHYVAFKRLFPNESFNKDTKSQWVVCDDSRVDIIDESDVLKRKAYMLMYERISGRLE